MYTKHLTTQDATRIGTDRHVRNQSGRVPLRADEMNSMNKEETIGSMAKMELIDHENFIAQFLMGNYPETISEKTD